MRAMPRCALLLVAAGCAEEPISEPARLGRPVGSDDGGATPWFEQRASALVARMTAAQKIGQLGNVAPAIPALGLPVYAYGNEGLHGVVAARATSFPQSIALGATWDPDLVHRLAV